MLYKHITFIVLFVCFIPSFFIYQHFFQLTEDHYLKLDRPSLSWEISDEKLQAQIKILNNYLKFKPDNIHYLTSLARSYATLKDWLNALKIYDQLIEIKPKNADFLIEKAYVLIQKEQTVLLPSIIELVQKTLLINSKQTYALLVSGLLSYEIGKLDIAKNIWKKHQSLINPKHPNFKLVDAYLQKLQKLQKQK